MILYIIRFVLTSLI